MFGELPAGSPILTRRQFLTRGLVLIGVGGPATGAVTGASESEPSFVALHLRVARLEVELSEKRNGRSTR